MISILHMADLHLETTFAYLSADRKHQMQEQQLAVLHQIMQIAKEQQIDFITIAGDLFESIHVQERTIQFLLQEFSNLENTQIIINPGNHDYWYPGSCWDQLDVLEHVHIFQPKIKCFYFADKQIAFWGKPFYSQSAAEPLWNREDSLYYEKNKAALNILVQHGDLFDSGSNYNPLYLDLIDQLNFQVALLGHIHNPPAIQHTRKGIPCIYSGSVQGRGFDETGEKGIYLLELDEQSGAINWSFKILNSPRFYRIPLAMERFENIDYISFTNILIESLLEKIGHEIGKFDCCKLLLQGFYSKNINVHLLSERMQELFFYAEVQDLSKMKPDQAMLLSEHSLRGDVARYAKQLATQPDLLHQVLCSLDLQDVNMKMAEQLIEQGYYFTLQAAEQELDIYEN